jgi:SAM-dependent methyltransferase
MKICFACGQAYSSKDWQCPSCTNSPSEIEGIVLLSPELCQASGGFKPEYFSQLSQLEANSFWFRTRNQIILSFLRPYLRKARHFLEVGCGTAFVLAAISKTCSGLKLSGSEIFLDGLFYASLRVPSAELLQMDARSIPFINHFDGIGAFDVLEHIEDDGIVLAQMFKALKSKGFLMITVPQHSWLWSAADVYACHQRRYTQSELVRKIREAGFKIDYLTSFVSLLLPLMALQRLLSRLRKYDPGDEFRISPFLNSALYLVMQFELTLLRVGLRFPIGGSLLLLARKP